MCKKYEHLFVNNGWKSVLFLRASHPMYVCVKVALRGVPMGSGVQLGLGEGPIKWVQCPNPVGTIGPTLRTLAHTCAMHFL